MFSIYLNRKKLIVLLKVNGIAVDDSEVYQELGQK